MKRIRDKLGRAPLIVARLVVASAVMFAAAVALLAAGVKGDDVALTVGGGGVVVLVTLLFTAPFTELTRRLPKLQLTATEAEKRGRLTQTTLPPWPVDIDRIVINDTHDAMKTIRHASFTDVTRAVFGMRKPTAEQVQRAEEKFRARVEQHAKDLREWLADYTAAAIQRYETFEVELALTNAPRAGHANNVVVLYCLPDTVTLTNPVDSLEPPPAMPRYQAPMGTSMFDPSVNIPEIAYRFESAHVIAARRDELFKGLREPTWEVSDDGRRLSTRLSSVHAAMTLDLPSLCLRVAGPGEHELHWQVFYEDGGVPASGTISLVLPMQPNGRPPFGKIEGILRFPDVVVDNDERDGDDDVEALYSRRAADLRESDPPLAPPPDDAGDEVDALARLQAAGPRWAWNALGLDPANDLEPDPDVRVVRSDDPT